VYFPSSPGDSCPELKLVSWRAGTPIARINDVSVPPKTQHCAYFTVLKPEETYWAKIWSDPCHSVGAVPSEKSEPQLPMRIPFIPFW